MEKRRLTSEVNVARYAPLAILVAFLLVAAAVVRRDGEGDAALIRSIETSRIKSSRVLAIEQLRSYLNRTESLIAADALASDEAASQLAMIQANTTAARNTLGEASSVAAQSRAQVQLLQAQVADLERQVRQCQEAQEAQMAAAAATLQKLHLQRSRLLKDAGRIQNAPT